MGEAKREAQPSLCSYIGQTQSKNKCQVKVVFMGAQKEKNKMNIEGWHRENPQWDPRGRAPGATYRHGATQVHWAEKATSAKAALDKLQIGTYTKVLVINGGAKGLTGEAKAALIDLFTKVLAPLAEKYNMLLVDGGTWDGIMQANGAARHSIRGTYKLLGIAPGGAAKQEDGPPRDAKMWPCLVEPAHSHLILVEEGGWGNETDFMFQVVAEAAKGRPSVAIISNGGPITVNEALANVRQGRHLIVIKNSGRFADDLIEAMETGTVRENMTGAKDIPAILARKDLITVVALGDINHFQAALQETLGLPA